MQELYALGGERTARFVRAFLDQFLPDRIQAAADYSVPAFAADPRHVFQTDDEIVAYLESHPTEPYGLYWHDGAGRPRQAMTFFTVDGRVIFGLAVDDALAPQQLRELTRFIAATHARLGWEAPPPDSADAFIRECDQAGPPT